MPEQDQEVIREFLIESHENLSRLDQRLVDLEQDPRNAALLADIFRTFHTIKGTCGFFGYATLERITHRAENLLSQLRDGQRELNPALVSLILETLDATRKILAFVEADGSEGPDRFENLTERLRICAQNPNAAPVQPVASLPTPAPPPSPQNGAVPETAAAASPNPIPPNLPLSLTRIFGSRSACWTSSWTWWGSWC